ncbi:MAG TPA: lysophospholipid acyltransferase family protein [Planctomycetota bacterium]|jgi:KDO2-lipid IV(A) lauroyltransferase
MLTRLSFRAISSLTGILPRRWQYALARPLSDVFCLAARGKRRCVMANLRPVLGEGASDAEIHRNTRAIFRSFGAYLCEFFGFEQLGARFIDSHVEVRGRENIEAALRLGRGAILCSGHYSNWELGACVVARLGYPITAVFQMQADARTNEMFVEQRARAGVTVVHTQHGARAALRALRQNQTVALMGDRLTGGPTIGIKLFGREVRFPLGPWRIANVSGAALLPVFIHREPEGRFILDIGFAIECAGETPAERIAALAQGWAGCLEERLKSDPAQWAAFYNVWETQDEQLLNAPRIGQASVRRIHGEPIAENQSQRTTSRAGN